MALQAVKLKGRIGPDGRLEILDGPAGLPEGEVEVILLYPAVRPEEKGDKLPPEEWPVLKLPVHDLGEFLGKSLRREEIYNDNGR